jgi:hypothetical protein
MPKEKVWVRKKETNVPNPKLVEKVEPGIIIRCTRPDVYEVSRTIRRKAKSITVNIDLLRPSPKPHPSLRASFKNSRRLVRVLETIDEYVVASSKALKASEVNAIKRGGRGRSPVRLQTTVVQVAHRLEDRVRAQAAGPSLARTAAATVVCHTTEALAVWQLIRSVMPAGR